MNIFELDRDPIACARMHCDRHAVKMPTEYCQLLCTAHRVLDGVESASSSASGRRIRRWTLPDEREEHLMKASYVGHPAAAWTRESRGNYRKLYRLYSALLKEYSRRYRRIHGAAKYSRWLRRSPRGMRSLGETELPQCMPERCRRSGDAVAAYREYYVVEKRRIAEWRHTAPPTWFVERSAT